MCPTVFEAQQHHEATNVLKKSASETRKRNAAVQRQKHVLIMSWRQRLSWWHQMSSVQQRNAVRYKTGIYRVRTSSLHADQCPNTHWSMHSNTHTHTHTHTHRYWTCSKVLRQSCKYKTSSSILATERNRSSFREEHLLAISSYVSPDPQLCDVTSCGSSCLWPRPVRQDPDVFLGGDLERLSWAKKIKRCVGGPIRCSGHFVLWDAGNGPFNI